MANGTAGLGMCASCFMLDVLHACICTAHICELWGVWPLCGHSCKAHHQFCAESLAI